MLMQFAGRFHPLIVHLPIGFLILAFLLECFSSIQMYRKFRSAVAPSLILGAISAWLACLTGYWLKQEGDFADEVVNPHQYVGIATAIFATLLVVFRRYTKTRFSNVGLRKKIRIVSFIPLMILLSITGHFGGSLTHGDDYLSFVNMEEALEVDPAVKIRQVSNLDSAVLFEDLIQPLFDAKCVSCHSSKKQKGDLRLDGKDFIRKGGKNGELFLPGIPDSSLLFKRITLPLEDKHHMPPEERTQLTSAEINLIQSWINDGCNFSRHIYEFADAGKVKMYLAAFMTPKSVSILPTENIDPADEKILSSLRNAGVIILPAEENSNYISANFTNVRTISNELLTLLSKLDRQLLTVDLNFTNINDQQMSSIGELKALRVLYLNNTAITDVGIQQLKPLANLQMLSMTNTTVTDQIFSTINEMKLLRKIYLFNTAVTREGVTDFMDKHKKIEIDTGNYNLPKLASDTLIYKRKI